jgi:hypothetical protein
MNTCEFCNTSFSTKYNLEIHKKRAKKCLLIQNQKTIQSEIIKDNFSCSCCNKIFTTNQYKNEHEKKCINKTTQKYLLLTKEKEIQELKEQVKDLQNKLASIAELEKKKPTTTTTKNTNVFRINTNIINQLAPYDLDKDKIRAIVNEKFTEEHLYDQETGIANFAVKNILTNDDGQLKMVCTDISRKIVSYKDTDGNIYKEPNANTFMETYIPSINTKSYQLISSKNDDDMVALAKCFGSIDNATIVSKLVSKLVPNPTK